MPRVLIPARLGLATFLGIATAAASLQVIAQVPATANPAGTHLVINEVSGGNGTGTGATDEFIELYNPTSETITFTGRVLYKSATGTQFSGQGPVTDFVLAPHGYWLVAGVNYSGTAPSDSSYSFDVSASTTGGGHVLLTSTTGTVTDPFTDPGKIDLIGWGTANKPETTAAPSHPAAGGSLHRTNGVDTDNNSVDFVTAATRSPRGSATNGRLTLTKPGAQSFAVGAAITPFSLSAGGGLAPYTYAVSSGALPSGLTLGAATGEISGTPTAAQSAADVTIRATDRNGDPVFSSFSVAVTADVDPVDPVSVSNPGSRSFTVGTAATPFSLAASGGAAPYTYAVTNGSLPAGIELDEQSGEISGTPTAATAATDVTVTATDVGGRTGATTFSVAVSRGALTTVTPMIDNTAPMVGDVLTAVPGSWGPAPVTLAFQWLSGGAVINDATDPTLTVTSDLLDTAIAVRVTGSRAEYEPTSVTSVATSAVTQRQVQFTTSPAVTGTLAVGQTLTADPGTTVPDNDDPSYQWRRDDVPIDGADDDTYVLAVADLGADISVEVTASHSGYADASETSPARGPVVAGTFAVGPSASITGTARVGETLTAGTGTTSPVATSFVYAWKVDGVPVGDGAATLSVTPAMVGETVTVTVTAVRGGYVDASDESEPTAAVVRAAFATGPSAGITGTPVVGGTLTATTGTTNPAATSFTYAWKAGDVPVGDGAATLSLTPAMVGETITVTVTAVRGGYVDASDESAPTAAVVRAAFATGPSAGITGTPVVGGTLTATTGTTNPAATSFLYAWKAGGEPVGDGSAALSLTPAMVGETVTVTVTAVRDGYVDAVDESDPTAAVARGAFSTGPSATITGTARVGETLTATTGTTSPAATSFTYVWKAGDVPVGDGAATLSVTPAMVGETVTVTVTAERDGYVDAVDESDPTAAVARAAFATGPSAGITGTPVVGGTLTATTGTTNPAATSFLYAWKAGGEPVGDGSAALSLTPAMVGETVTVTVTAERDGYVDASDESAPTGPIERATFSTGPAVSIEGTARVGQVLSAATGTPVPAPDSLSYRWFAGDDLIAGAAEPQLTLTGAQLGQRVSVEVTAIKVGFVDAVARSAATVAVVSTSAPRLSVRVSVPKSAGKTRDGTPAVLQRGLFTVAWTASAHGDDLIVGGTGELGKLLRKRFGDAVPARGKIAVRLTAYGWQRLRMHATSASGTTRASSVVTVVRPPKRLKVQAPKSAKPGATVRVRVHGLGRGEHFLIRVAGSTSITGRASRDGVVVRRLVVPAQAARQKRLRIVAFGRTDLRRGSAVVVLR